ncbi:CoA-binding protein [Demequina sp. SO4-13]|uniref:CoA-binding protein n=1 Tax=Demequina sp. SO4-13 TaxID=3401027 RepID=UPI003AF746EC
MSIELPGKPTGEACPTPSATAATAPDDDALVDLLSRARTVAVVGASPNDHRTSYSIAAWLMTRTPYEVYLVNPMAEGQEIRGHGFYSSLAELPVVPDIVDVFRRSEHVPPVADDAIEVGAGALWMQLGVSHEEAAGRALDAGLDVVQDRCIKVEYERLRDAVEQASAQ